MNAHVQEVTGGDFEKEVMQSDLPVMLSFHADWCGPCRLQLPILEGLGEDFVGRAKVVKLDVDDNPEIAKRFGISGIPTNILIVGGKETNRMVGLTTKSILEGMLNGTIKPA